MLDSANLVDGKPALSMTLSNVGTGPARIGWFHLVDDRGNSYSKNFYERVRQVDPTAAFTSQQIGGTLMRSGEARSAFDWPRPAEGSAALASWNKLEQDRFTLHGSACYCSMFNECSVTDFQNEQPSAVESCEKADAAKK